MCECIPSVVSEDDESDVGNHGVYSSLVSMLGFGQEMVDFAVLLGRPRPAEKSLQAVSSLPQTLLSNAGNCPAG